MQTRPSTLCLLIGFSFLQLGLRAQYYHWEKIGVQEGLISANVFTVFADPDAFLWIGTDQGASRYDGFEFTNYAYAGNQRIGQVNTFALDRNGRLWAGSSLGLFLWDGQQFLAVPAEPTGIRSIVFAGQQLWIGTDKGIFQASEATLSQWITTQQSPVFSALPLPLEFRDDPRITDLYLGPSGHLYATTYYCLLRWNTDHWVSLLGDPDQKPDIMSVVEIAPNELIIASEALYFQYWKNGKTTEIKDAPPTGLDVVAQSDRYLMLTYDLLMEKNAAGWQTILTDEETGIEWMRSLCLDRHGTIWVATFEGLLKIKPTAFQYFNPEQYPLLQEIYAIGESPKNEILFGGNRGRVYCLKDQQIVPYLAEHWQLVPNAEIFAIYQTRDQSMWFGSGYQGIVQVRDGKLETFRTPQGLGDDARFFFYEAPDSTFWTGGDGSIDQIILMDGVVNFKSYDYSVPAQYVIFKNAVMDANHILWLASDFGLFRLHNQQLELVEIIDYSGSALAVNDLALDDQQRLWLATNGEGILECTINPAGLPQLLRQHKRTNGLAADTYLQLLFDYQGSLWASSYTGLCRMQDGALRCYDAADGFLDKTYSNLCLYQASDSLIWAGSSEGVIAFNPSKIMANKFPPVLVLNEVSLFGGEEDIQPYRQDTLLTKTQLTLPYYQNNITFSYTGVNLLRPDKTIFKYRLHGLSDKWMSTGFNQQIVYPKLAPGHYQFELKAANEDGLWSSPVVYTFDILPPFWLRSWFFGVLMLVFTLGIWLIFREQERRNKVRQQLIEAKLQALQAQMNPHFLSNALNAINYFILENNAFSASRYLTKFSRLVRSILDHSQEVSISLKQEVDALRLYLDLEKLRFENRFDFTIHISENLAVQLIQVPPLIIQPFAENAILHGFQNGCNSGRLQIKIYREEETLKCEVIDNGIGRTAAREIQRKKGRKTGQGQQITTNRLQLLSQRAEAILITDRYDEQGRAQGTKVLISFPLNYGVKV